MWRLSLLLFPIVLSGGAPQVALYDSEIWLMRDSRLLKLTHDKKVKGQPILSPSGTQIAYFEQCPVAEQCTPSIVILDLRGDRKMEIQPQHHAVPPVQPCASILRIEWAGENGIGAECHLNPSVNEYVELDLASGRLTRDLLGYAFVRSPDDKHVAYGGWTMHFAPPYAQSSYVRIDDGTIYPRAAGMDPRARESGLPKPPAVVGRRGPTYTGIHDLCGPIVWSPDSKHIAFIDSTYDWTPTTPSTLTGGDGKESNRRYSLTVAAPDREPLQMYLDRMTRADLLKANIEWAAPDRAVVRFGAVMKSLVVH